MSLNPGNEAAALRRSPGFPLPNASRVRADTSESKSPTGNGRLTTTTSETDCPKGKGRAKRRKEAAETSKVSDHPSVVIASSWTDRQEQAEEVRARDAIYCSQRSDTVAVDTSDTYGNSKARWIESVKFNKAGSKPRPRRPWEWSVQDCQILAHDALYHPKGAPEQLLDERFETEDEAATAGLYCATKPASLPARETLSLTLAADILRGLKKNAEESPQKKPPARRVRGRCNGSTGMRTVKALGSSSDVNGQGEVVALMVLMDDAHSAMEQEAVRAKHEKFRYTASYSANDKGNIQENDSEVRANDPLASDSSGEVDAMMDEKKARELSAALDQNIPRHGRFQATPDIAEGKHELETDHIERPSNSNSIGKSIRSAGLMHERLAIDTGAPCGTSAVPFDSTALRNELRVHPWISAGLEFGLGTLAEVWWEDDKWYKCCISKISNEGRWGELEFLPYRRKTIAREFSAELDLDELIREGHLVLPGTHL